MSFLRQYSDLFDKLAPELFAALVVLFLTAGFHFVFWMGKYSEKMDQAEKDLDGIAEKAGTERALARLAKKLKKH